MSLKDETPKNNQNTSKQNDSDNDATLKRQREEELSEETAAVIGKSNDDKNPTKKAKIDTFMTSTENNDEKKNGEILDICEKLNMKEGTRIQVRWIIHKNDNDDDGDDDNQSPQQQQQQQQQDNENNSNNNSISLWWEATLLPYTDKRTHTLSSADDDDSITLPIRTLQYDAKPQHGFDESSLEDVVFLTPDSLMSLSNVQQEMNEEGGVSEEQPWRLCSNSTLTELEEDDEAALTIPGTEEATRNMLDLILQSSLTKFTSQMNKLPASSKAIIAEKMAVKKEQMVAGLMRHLEEKERENGGSGVTTVTEECVQRCVADMMQKEDSL